jgi:hypothetical protein
MTRTMPRLTPALLLALALGLLAGCTQGSLTEFIQALETRQVQSCVKYEGNAGPYVRVEGTTATGGFPLAECLRQ